MNSAIAFLERHRERLDLARYQIANDLSSLILTPRFAASGHVVFLVLPEGRPQPCLVVKIPRLVDAAAALACESSNLQAVQALRPAGFESVPRLVAFEEHDGRPILVETALNGPLMAPDIVRRDLRGCCRLVMDWLADIHQASASTPARGWFEHVIEQPLQSFSEMFPLNTGEQALLARTWELVVPLREAGLPFICEHGDLSHPNLIVRGAEDLGVVDWELAQSRGLIGYDLFLFLSYAAFSLRKARSPRSQLAAFDEAFFSPGAWAVPMVLAYWHRLQLPVSTLTPLFVSGWARYTINLLRRLTNAAPQRSGRVDAATADWLRANRYYLLWNHAVAHAHLLGWAG
jgi:aminoglycoside phosphotransferase (APT) family kinase protein